MENRIQLFRTDSDNQDFRLLVQALDTDLAQRDSDEHIFYAQLNKMGKISFVVVAYDQGKAIGCGAFREHAPEMIEIKRMYVVPSARKKGVASAILQELEKWATELSYKKMVLETGKRQPEAIQLYERNGYRHIPNFGSYVGVENSVCFEKNVED
jgi:putative acetyltransferase